MLIMMVFLMLLSSMPISNGYSDALETTPLVIPETDGDGKRAFQDLDSDNDSILDIFENWFC